MNNFPSSSSERKLPLHAEFRSCKDKIENEDKIHDVEEVQISKNI